ncbi:MAG: polysaccharide deacetylase family protein [Capsulimonadales bacterium]|nr:polysaccharide deacetylase family protein [Capsulimonadales bacterium]
MKRPPICLTGDLHHSSLGTGNQKHCDITELQTGQLYLDLLTSAGVKATFFISGKCFAEEWQDTQPICASPLVEVGGHNYDCFEAQLFHRLSKKLLGSYNGPRWYQERDARRTIAIIEARTGRRTRVWRNHMYMHGPYTESVLAKCGCQVCSDGVKRAAMGPEWHDAGIFNFPINVIPDHEHLFHAERTREWVEQWVRRYDWSDDFGPQSYEVEEWAQIVLENLQENEARGAISNLIIHPITMYLCDRFNAFERILDFIAARETIWVSEAVERVAEERREVVTVGGPK